MPQNSLFICFHSSSITASIPTWHVCSTAVCLRSYIPNYFSKVCIYAVVPPDIFLPPPYNPVPSWPRNINNIYITRSHCVHSMDKHSNKVRMQSFLSCSEWDISLVCVILQPFWLLCFLQSSVTLKLAVGEQNIRWPRLLRMFAAGNRWTVKPQVLEDVSDRRALWLL